VLSEIGFGLLAAIGWGTGDFLAKLSSDRIGYLRTALYMQLISAVFLIPFSVPDIPRLWQYPQATAGAVALGIISLIGLLALYKGFQIGKLSIVSPIVSGYPAFTSLFAVLLLAETLSTGRMLGIGVTISGILLISFKSQTTAQPSKPAPASGILYAFGAFVLFGLLYLAMKLVVVILGIWLPILILRWVSAGILGISLLASGRDFSIPGSKPFLVVGFVAVLDTLGNIAFNLGVISGSVAIVATLSGLFSAVTVGLAWLYLRDRFSKYQILGILAILFGVAFIGYFV
jgi:drug/metabolite transporter (DMT)-like permease